MRAADDNRLQELEDFKKRLNQAVEAKNWEAYSQVYNELFDIRTKILFEDDGWKRDQTQNFDPKLSNIFTTEHIQSVLDAMNKENHSANVIAKISQHLQHTATPNFDSTQIEITFGDLTSQLRSDHGSAILLNLVSHNSKLLSRRNTVSSVLPANLDDNNKQDIKRTALNLNQAINTLRKDQERLLNEVNKYRLYFNPRKQIYAKDMMRVNLALSKAAAIAKLIHSIENASSPTDLQNIIGNALSDKDLIVHRPKGHTILRTSNNKIVKKFKLRNAKTFEFFKGKRDEINKVKTKSDTHNHLLKAHQAAIEFKEKLGEAKIDFHAENETEAPRVAW